MVSHQQEASLQDFILRVINHHIFSSPLDRGIVFCDTVEDATVLANLIGAPFYVGRMDAQARSQAVNTWLSGRSKWLCATSAFAQGIDYSHVTYVIHYRIPKHITLHAQQSGRLARQEGTVGVSHLIYSTVPPHLRHFDVDLGGFGAMVEFATKAQCRRIAITNFLDPTPSNCHMLGPCEPCDFCCRHNVCISCLSHFLSSCLFRHLSLQCIIQNLFLRCRHLHPVRQMSGSLETLSLNLRPPLANPPWSPHDVLHTPLTTIKLTPLLHLRWRRNT